MTTLLYMLMGSEEGCDSDSDVETWSSIGKRKKKRDKKKRKKHHYGDDNLDETIDMGTTEQTKNSGSRWFLSTDDSSCAWNTVCIFINFFVCVRSCYVGFYHP